MMSEDWAGTLEQFIAAESDRGLADGTLRHRRYYVGQLAEHAPASPAGLSREDLARFLAQPRWQGNAERAARQALRAFCGWAYATGRIPEDLSPARLGKRVRYPTAWASAIQGFLNEAAGRGLSAKTVRLWRWRLMSIAELLPDPWAVTTADLREYMATQTGWAPETRKSVRSTLRGFYSWALEEGYVDVNPAERLRPTRIPAAVPRPAQEDTIEAAMAAAEPRVQLMMALAAYAGLRAAEIASVNVADLDGDVLRICGKGGVVRVVPLGPGLLEAVAAWPDVNGWLFPHPRTGKAMTAGTVTKLVSRALPPGVTCHMLRHRFASAAYAAEPDIYALATVMGHSRVETTQRYTLMPDAALRRVVRGVGDYRRPAGTQEAADGPVGCEVRP